MEILCDTELNGKVLGPLVYQTRCIVIDPNKISKSMRKRAREFLDEIFFIRNVINSKEQV